MSVWDRLFRAQEATPDQLVATGAAGFGYDPVDGDSSYRQIGQGAREVPSYTLQKARAYSVAAYRSNPMARAIIDTYTSFCVGDEGVRFQASNPDVEAVVARWWNDPRNAVLAQQDAMLRDHMLMGESVFEVLVGQMTGAVRFSLIDPDRVVRVGLDRGNPLWFASVDISGLTNGISDVVSKRVIAADDLTGLLGGEVHFFRSWNALLTDRRGTPFLTPLQDDLDAFDAVLNNLVDRTALMRYIAMDVTLTGADQPTIDKWVAQRGGVHVPRSGTIEVHNESVAWKPIEGTTGAFEDTQTLGQILTNVAGGAGLAKTWLSDPEGANRATAMSMAEPVRRRVGGVQKLWLSYVRQMARHVVDQAVAARLIPAQVEASNARTGAFATIPASEAVQIIGPEIAAADAQVTATTLLNLGQALEAMRTAGVISGDAAALLVQKGWEMFTGQPFRADLAVSPDASVDNVADMVDDATSNRARLRPVASTGGAPA